MTCKVVHLNIIISYAGISASRLIKQAKPKNQFSTKNLLFSFVINMVSRIGYVYKLTSEIRSSSPNEAASAKVPDDTFALS
jgi:hypothetical protein